MSNITEQHKADAIRRAARKGFKTADYEAALEFLFNNQPKRIPKIFPDRSSGAYALWTFPSGNQNFVYGDHEVVTYRRKRYYSHIAQDADGMCYEILF